MVAALGHNVPRVFMMTFGFGSALAAVAGVLGGNVLGTEPAMAAQLGPIIFVVIVLGGLGSLGGAVIASLAIGILTNMAISYDISFKTFFFALGVSPDAVGVGQDSDCHDQRIHCSDPALPHVGIDADFSAARIIWNP